TDDKDEAVTYADPRRGIYKKIIVREGRLAGAILLGDSGTAPRLLQAFHQGEYVPENPAELLFVLTSQTEAHSAADAPDSLQICNCNGVSKSKIGLASLLKTIWGKDYVDERDARFINDRVHANIQKDATFSVVPRIYGGVTTPQQLRTIADVAEKYQVPMVKITGGQRIDLLGVRKEQLPAIWNDLGMPSGHAYTKAVRTVKTCVGEEFCRYGVGDSTGLGIKIEQKFQVMEAPHKIKMAASGCPRNCAESMVKDVGVVAIDGGRWEVYEIGRASCRERGRRLGGR